MTKSSLKLIVFFLFTALTGCASHKSEITSINSVLDLNLRIHIMTGGNWMHPSGQLMKNRVADQDILNSVLPEINRIWAQANIIWNVEQIISEPIVQDRMFQNKIDFVVRTKRDKKGRSDPARQPLLYELMAPENKSSKAELNANLFHIYIFPFIGNTSQGNAMKPFGKHVVLGSWSNKHNRGRTPKPVLLTEDQSAFARGSLARTAAHELGHVLGLTHSCDNCLMHSGGYSIDGSQVGRARREALRRVRGSSSFSLRIEILT